MAGYSPLEYGWLKTLRSLTLPAFALGLVQSALIARIARSTMLDVLREQFITAGRAKGLAESTVVYKHALKNAMIATVTVIGISFAILISGSVVVEQVFNIPGLGRLIISGAAPRLSRDPGRGPVTPPGTWGNLASIGPIAFDPGAIPVSVVALRAPLWWTGMPRGFGCSGAPRPLVGSRNGGVVPWCAVPVIDAPLRIDVGRRTDGARPGALVAPRRRRACGAASVRADSRSRRRRRGALPSA